MSEEFRFDIYKETFYNEPKEIKKFINSCKRMVRNSYEYSEWLHYIKFNMGLDKCVLTYESSNEVTVEIHHHPISIENIIRIVFEKHMSNINIDTISTIEIVSEVINLHKMYNVGFVPLVTTLHEKFHNGFLEIPMEVVNGNWNYILNNYEIPSDIMKTIEKYRAITMKTSLSSNWIKVSPEGVLEEVA